MEKDVREHVPLGHESLEKRILFLEHVIEHIYDAFIQSHKDKSKDTDSAQRIISLLHYLPDSDNNFYSNSDNFVYCPKCPVRCRCGTMNEITQSQCTKCYGLL